VNRNGKTTQIAVHERNARREKKTKNGIDGGKNGKTESVILLNIIRVGFLTLER